MHNVKKLLNKKNIFLIFILLIFVLTGCSIGRTKVLFATNTSIGLDVDTLPPTTDLGYNRQEGIIAPVYPAGETFPVVTSQAMQVNGAINALGFGNYQSFLTGDAAVAYSSSLVDGKFDKARVEEVRRRKISNIETPIEVKSAVSENSKSLNNSKSNYLQSLEIIGRTQDVQKEAIIGFDPSWKVLGKSLLKPFIARKEDLRKAKPYFFGTNTTLGVNVKWSPTGSPKAANIGLKRQELALMPITAKIKNEGDQQSSIVRRIPSLLAMHNDNAGIGVGGTGNFGASSIFATGLAADLLSTEPYVVQSLGGTVLDTTAGIGPDILIKNSSVEEGNTGHTPLEFKVQLSRRFDKAITVEYETIQIPEEEFKDETDRYPAIEKKDYEPSRGTLLIEAGEVEENIVVNIIGDVDSEKTGVFMVKLRNAVPTNVNIKGRTAFGLIENDDQ